VRVEMARAGDDDGLVIGVTTFDPLTAIEIYEVANMVPDSWSLGYDGSAQIDDEEDMRDISWQPNLLKKGDTVGLLVRSDGLVLYQNGVQVEEVKCGNSPAGKPLYPMIDLLGGTDAVSLILGATPPEVTGVTPSPAPKPAALATQPAAAAEPPATGWFGANAEEPATTPAPPALSQFNAAQTSAHVTISAGGLKARYIGGTKEDEMCGVVFGDGVIPSFDKGQYFEVRVEMARAGDDDGLVIGVTTFDPLKAKEIYEVANMLQ